jgi:hypothetical protein
MKIKLSLFFLFLFLLTPCLSFAQSSKEALMALKKLQAKIQVGISYKEYGPACGDAKFPVNLFLESPQAKQNVKFTQSIKDAMKHYEGALEVWSCRFGLNGLTEVLSTPLYDPVIQNILRNNPELRSLVAQNNGNLPITQARDILLRLALQDTDNASRLFSMNNKLIDSKE